MTEREKYDPRQLIAILSPQAVDLFHIPGGWDHITPSLVAAALAIVRPEASTFGKIKYARMNSEAHRLATMTLNIVTQRPYRRTWPKSEPDRRARTVVNLALIEAVHPPVCDTCNGRKVAEIGSLKVTCGGCGGTGMRYSVDAARARALQLSEDEWTARWKRLHSSVIVLTSRWDDQLYSAMRALSKETSDERIIIDRGEKVT